MEQWGVEETPQSAGIFVLHTGIARELVLLCVTVVDDVSDGSGKDFIDFLVSRIDPGHQQVFDGRLVVVAVDVQ